MIDEVPVGELGTLRPLRAALHRHHAALDVPAGYTVRGEDEPWQEWLAAASAAVSADRGVVFAHRTGDVLDGLAYVVLLDPAALLRPVLVPEGGHAELVTLVVDDHTRGAGVGARLMDRAQDWARAHGAATMHIGVRATNLDAIRFYRRLGAREAFTSMLLPLS